MIPDSTCSPHKGSLLGAIPLFYKEIFFQISSKNNEPPKQQEGVGKFQTTQTNKAATGVKVSQEQSRSVDAAKRPQRKPFLTEP